MCIFCERKYRNKILIDNDLAFVIADEFPVNFGHLLILPKRHAETWFDLTLHEQEAICLLINKAKDWLVYTCQPDGYNIGINIGEDAGQTIFHCHVHVIPRYKGDVENPKGGIRNFKVPIIEY